jgi:dTDP-4-amino-4,6-dideoxygalactose transaminase
LLPVTQYLGYTEKDFPVAVKLGTRIMSLPIYPSMAENQQDQVIELIARFYNS